MLVDSGSSSSFIAASVAAQLPQLQRSPLKAFVKVANGQLMQCEAIILGCQFTLEGHQLRHDLCILHLNSYDLILGMDWLEHHSSMQIHWSAKWMIFLHEGTSVMLHDLSAISEDDLVFHLFATKAPESSQLVQELPR